MNTLRSTLATWADRVLGEKCRLGCGTRVFPADVRSHENTNHAGDPT